VITSDRRIAVGLFLVAFITYAWFFSGGGWNQNAHFDLTRALVERQTLHIDGYRVNTGDISWTRNGGEWHSYINKPPGVSFLGAIPYAPLWLIERAANVPYDSWLWMTINAWLVTVFTCGLTGALIPAVLYLYGARRVSRVAALGVALAVAFGTGVFPYTTLLMAHVPPALFLLLAFVWLDERPLLAGICAGIAGVSHYLCIPAAIVMLIALAIRNRPAALRFALGGAPFGLALAAYHYVCFGSPFMTSVETSTNFTEKGLLFGVFRLPLPEAMWGLTFSEYRGLFFASPFLLLTFLGLPRMKRRDAVVILTVAAIFFFAISGFNGWHGGAAFGPRYLVPILPLLAIPMLYLRGRVLGVIAVVLGVYAFGLHLLATAVNPTPSPSDRQPVRNFYLKADHTSATEQSIDELIPRSNHPRGTHECTWASFNLGETVFGAGNPWSVLPIVVWVVGGSVWLWRRSRALRT
jgi:MFS family permease